MILDSLGSRVVLRRSLDFSRCLRLPLRPSLPRSRSLRSRRVLREGVRLRDLDFLRRDLLTDLFLLGVLDLDLQGDFDLFGERDLRRDRDLFLERLRDLRLLSLALDFLSFDLSTVLGFFSDDLELLAILFFSTDRDLDLLRFGVRDLERVRFFLRSLDRDLDLDFLRLGVFDRFRERDLDRRDGFLLSVTSTRRITLGLERERDLRRRGDLDRRPDLDLDLRDLDRLLERDFRRLDLDTDLDLERLLFLRPVSAHADIRAEASLTFFIASSTSRLFIRAAKLAEIGLEIAVLAMVTRTALSPTTSPSRSSAFGTDTLSVNSTYADFCGSVVSPAILTYFTSPVRLKNWSS